MTTNLRKIFIILFSLIYSIPSFSQDSNSPYGLFFSIEDEMKDVEMFSFNNSSVANINLPFKKSLRKYAPTPRDQDGGTCVGWATSYSAISIMFNSITNTTNQVVKDFTAFDAYFIYSIIKTVDDYSYCGRGLNIERALKNISYYGAKNWYITNPPGFEENNINDFCDDRYNLNLLNNWSREFTRPFSPKKFYYLKNNGRDNYINQVKYNITQKRPIIFGIDLRESIEKIGKNGLWNPNMYENTLGGHAMTIIGYDDYKFGGSFEIMNSWGADFAENGFLWIPYDKFYSLIKERQLRNNKTNSFVLEYEDNLYTSNNIKCLSDNTMIVNYSDGSKYFGSYVNNSTSDCEYNSSTVLTGYGQFRFNNGDIYIGQFKDGYIHGNGYFYELDSKDFCEVQYANSQRINEKCDF